MSDDNLDPTKRKLSFLQTISAVLWSFFGVRRGSSYREDVARLNPVYVIIAGVLGMLVFVGILMMVVRWVLASNGV
jgi:hypothetical protein